MRRTSFGCITRCNIHDLSLVICPLCPRPNVRPGQTRRCQLRSMWPSERSRSTLPWSRGRSWRETPSSDSPSHNRYLHLYCGKCTRLDKGYVRGFQKKIVEEWLGDLKAAAEACFEVLKRRFTPNQTTRFHLWLLVFIFYDSLGDCSSVLWISPGISREYEWELRNSSGWEPVPSFFHP